VRRIVVPKNAGVYSALGMLMSDLRRDYVRTEVQLLQKKHLKKIKATFKSVEKEAYAAYQKDKFKKREVSFKYFMDLRYFGQEHFVKTSIGKTLIIEDILENFHAEHLKRFAFQLKETSVEIVNFHLVAEVKVKKPVIPKVAAQGKKLKDAIIDEQEVDFDELGIAKSKFYSRSLLAPGMKIKGPAIISEAATSTVLPPGFILEVDDFENLIIRLK